MGYKNTKWKGTEAARSVSGSQSIVGREALENRCDPRKCQIPCSRAQLATLPGVRTQSPVSRHKARADVLRMLLHGRA